MDKVHETNPQTTPMSRLRRIKMIKSSKKVAEAAVKKVAEAAVEKVAEAAAMDMAKREDNAAEELNAPALSAAASAADMAKREEEEKYTINSCNCHFGNCNMTMCSPPKPLAPYDGRYLGAHESIRNVMKKIARGK